MSSGISLRHRRLVRSLARDCYRDARTDALREKLLQKRLEPYGIDPATVIALISLAIKLWLWWRERKVSDPGARPMNGEPS